MHVFKQNVTGFSTVIDDSIYIQVTRILWTKPRSSGVCVA